MPKIEVGQVFPHRQLTDTQGKPWSLPSERLTHLQLRRFAGCPICNVHMISVISRHAEIEAAGIQEVVVFNSARDILAAYSEDFPFPTIPDPEGLLYAELGVTTSPLFSATPGAVGAAFKGMLFHTMEMGVPRSVSSAFLLPADLLIAPSGKVVAVQYASHAAGQWSVDELLAHAAS